MSPEMARHRAALRLAFAATLALVWGTLAGEPLPGLTAVLAAQILVGMSRPSRPGQAAAVVAVIAATGGAAFIVAAAFADRFVILTAALGLLFFLGFAMRERAAGRPSLPATMLLNATAVVPVLTVQAHILGAGVVETLVTAAARAMLVVWLLYALFPAPQEEPATGAPAGGAPGTGPPVTGPGGAARTLAKVAIVLPAQLFYLAEPTALAFPALLGLVTFLSTQDPAAGRAQLVVRLGGLGGRSAAACNSINGAAWLPGVCRVDHDRRAASGRRGGADRPRDLSHALRPGGIARSIRRPGPRSDRGHLRALPLHSCSGHAPFAGGGGPEASGRRRMRPKLFMHSGVNLVSRPSRVCGCIRS
jgi:Protein of unknown function (DUF2955)